MSYTVGTANAHAVPVTVEFTFNGSPVLWGGENLYSMSPLSNRSEAVDGSYEISDLDVELIDTNGSIWGALGNGTSAFYKSFSATVYVGGLLDYYTYGVPGQVRIKKTSNVGAGSYTIHSGQIVQVSKRNRMVRLKSQNNLRALEDMEWRFPYREGYVPSPSVLGTWLFYPNNLATSYPFSMNKLNQEGNKFEVHAAFTTGTTATEDGLAFWYPSIPNRGTLGLLPNYVYPGTQFYTDCQVVQFQGSYFGVYVGTIETDNQAREYGFTSLDEAETTRSGSRYPIHKSRLNVADGPIPVGTRLFLQQNLVLSETPADLFRELVSGHCVTPYFGTSDIEQLSFGTSQSHTAFQSFSQRIDPKGGKVGPYIKDLVGATYGHFSVDVNNKFVYRAYGPRNLTASIGTINATTLIDSGFSSSRSDAKNRVVVKYGFTPEGGDFSRSAEVKSETWAGTLDNPVVVQTKWMQSDNEARVFAQRILNRFKNTAPKIDLTVSLAHSGVELGSLFNVVDPDSGISNKVVEVVSYEKDFTEGRKISFGCIDGESVYSRRGYGQWMGGTIQPSGNVSGTSTFGWGTAGTQANINTTLYGTMWVWF